jgi:hypothetical protein
VVAAFLQLNYSLAVVAPLPALFLRHLDETIRFFVFRALGFRVVPFVA